MSTGCSDEDARGPTIETSPQYRAEVKALWRGLGVLCPEAKRIELKAQFDDGSISLEVVSASLRIPVRYARELMQPAFHELIQRVK